VKEKIKAHEELTDIVEELKKKGKRVVFTNGCFDLLHAGHVRYLEQARSLGDALIVAVNSDTSVRALKGPRRPILPIDERTEILSGLGCIDYITVFDDPTPLALISLLRPDVLVKGGDWKVDQIVGKEILESTDGQVAVLPFLEGCSTTRIIETVLERYEKRS
jgi:D-beta-D-heptose 7-phosphate kinase / D-beta-D-heptose 1-phosphate adenosyltransferase